MNRTTPLVALPIALAAWAPADLAAQSPSLVGAWEPEAYVLADGPTHAVAGRIFFTDVDWTVLFFVTEEGEARRGSAEGGSYETRGDTLVFRHQWHLSSGEAMAGLPASPLRMRLVAPEDAAAEVSTFRISGDRLSVFFPSGNRMEFRRTSGF